MELEPKGQLLERTATVVLEGHPLPPLIASSGRHWGSGPPLAAPMRHYSTMSTSSSKSNEGVNVVPNINMSLDTAISSSSDNIARLSGNSGKGIILPTQC